MVSYKLNAMMKESGAFLALFFVAALLAPPAGAQTNEVNTCAVYFTGVGCPHCAKADPVVLEEMTGAYSDFVVIEYEIYQLRENAPLLQDYNSKYGTGLGVPLIIFGKDRSIVGDRPIMNNVEDEINGVKGNPCLTLDGKIKFEGLDLTELPAKPKIWKGDRILIKTGSGSKIEKIDAEPVALSGSKVSFENAAIVGGWRFQWDGEGIEEINISCGGDEKLVPNSEDLRGFLTDEDVSGSLQDLGYDCVAGNVTDGNGNNGEGDKSSVSLMASISILLVVVVIVIFIIWGMKR